MTIKCCKLLNPYVALLLTIATLSQALAAAEQDISGVPLAASRVDAEHDKLPGTAIAREDDVLQALYPAQNEHALWSERGRPTRQASELIAILRSAGSHGLTPGDYGADILEAERQRLTAAESTVPEAWRQFDHRLSRAALRLVAHLHYGRIDPRTAGFELKEPRNDLDLVATVTALTSAARVADALGRVEPHFLHYHLLKQALARYQTLAADPTLTQLPPYGRHGLHAGDTYAGTPSLRRLLMALGDIPVAEVPDVTLDQTLDQKLDPALVAALKHFQQRHGMTADGALGKQTFAALTTPLAQRVRQIELTLERWRWLPPFSSPPVIVNIPQFQLFAFRTVEDRADSILKMDVIVGKTFPETQTPVFVGDMQHVIFRPYWDVPRSILVKEMLPQIRANPAYLHKNHLEIVRGESDNSPVVPPTPAAIDALARGQLRLRQQPGDDNALGLIKFIFPNAHNVYLHSTPAHRLFEQSRRTFSHGCIRVSDPVVLAEYVLRNTGDTWDRERILAAMNSGPSSSRVLLQRPIPVMVMYGTAMATEAGPVLFFDDIYGYDRKLESLLGLHPVYSAAKSL